MAAEQASFVDVGDTNTLAVPQRGETLTIGISGTYNMTIWLERAVTPDRSAWEFLKAFATANATEAYSLTVERHNEVFRLRCHVDTSGTAVTTITTGDAQLYSEVDEQGVALRTTYQSKDVFHNDVEVEGSLKPEAIDALDASLGINGIAAAQGGAIVVTGGTSSTAGNAGGAVSQVGGTPGSTGIGGAASIEGGIGGSSSGAGGAASVTGGAATASNSAGGAASVTGGAGQGTSAGGAASVTSGAGEAGTTATAGASGAVTVASGAAGTATTGTGGAGGDVAVTAAAGGATSGAAGTGGEGGDLAITAGAGGADVEAGSGTGGAGGDVTITPGAGGAGATAGVAGHIYLRDQVVLKKQGTPTAKTVTAGISAAELLTGIITSSGVTGPSVHQLPTGTDLKAAIGGNIAAGDSFEFSLINTGTGAAEDATITVNTDVTIVGNPTAGALTDTTIISGSARFLVRFTTGTTFVVYRIA